MELYEAYGFGKYRTGCGTLRASGGDCGPGSEMLCVGRARERYGGVAPTLTGDHQNRVTDYTAIAVGNCQLNQISMAEQSNTLDCMHDQQAILAYGGDVSGTLDASYYNGTGARNGKEREFVAEHKCRKYIIRRLTPLECCRLQGFPDWWEDGVEGSDSARYKMWGNGMALHNMLFVMQNIARAMAEQWAGRCEE